MERARGGELERFMGVEAAWSDPNFAFPCQGGAWGSNLRGTKQRVAKKGCPQRDFIRSSSHSLVHPLHLPRYFLLEIWRQICPTFAVEIVVRAGVSSAGLT